MKKKYKTEFVKVPVICSCELKKKLELEVEIIKGSNDGETFTPQEINCPYCKKKRFIIKVPGRVPPDPVVRLGY